MIEAVEPEPACDEPEDWTAPVVLPDLLVPPPVLPVFPDVAPLLPVPVPVLPAAVPVLPVPVELAVPVPVLPADVPAAPPVPDAAETWPDSAWVRVRLALATCPWAVARAYFREVASKVARTCPAVTFWPMVTGTVATIPETAKDTVAALDGSVVPVACSVCTTGCEPTLAVTYVGAVPWDVA
jgi:hypothetical protein